MRKREEKKPKYFAPKAYQIQENNIRNGTNITEGLLANDPENYRLSRIISIGLLIPSMAAYLILSCFYFLIPNSLMCGSCHIQNVLIGVDRNFLMSGSCHLDRALNVEICVEYQIFVIVIFFNCSHQVLQFGAHSRYYKGALTQKRSF